MENTTAMLEELRVSSNKVAGRNNVLKALKNGSAKRVYLAKDIDNFLSQTIVNNAQENNVTIVFVETRNELAKLCNISVKTATAAILKQI